MTDVVRLVVVPCPAVALALVNDAAAPLLLPTHPNGTAAAGLLKDEFFTGLFVPRFGFGLNAEVR